MGDSSDEEKKLQAALQESIEEEEDEIDRQLKERLLKEQSTASSTTPNTSSGTFVAMPESNSIAHIELETGTDSTLSSNAESELITNLRRRAFSIKVFSVIDWVFGFYSLAIGKWSLILGILCAPLGFWGAHKFDRKIILGYITYLVLDIILQCIDKIRNKDEIERIVLGLSFLMITTQMLIIGYVYQFFKTIPSEGSQLHQELLRIPQTNLFPLSNFNERT